MDHSLGSGHNDDIEWDFNRLEVTSKDQAEQYINYLVEVIFYLVKIFIYKYLSTMAEFRQVLLDQVIKEK